MPYVTTTFSVDELPACGSADWQGVRVGVRGCISEGENCFSSETLSILTDWQAWAVVVGLPGVLH